MTKEFELKMPSETVNDYLKECGYSNAVGKQNEMKFANLCATWGANQEYRASYDFIDDAWGSDHARVYQESRRPIIQSEKEKALEALDYIDEMAIFNMKSYQCYESLKEYRNILYKLISSMPNEDT